MKKRVFAIILIVCLAAGAAFAASQSHLEVGLQVGYGCYQIQATDKEDSNHYVNLFNGGFYFGASAVYELPNGIGLRGEVGINNMSKAKFKARNDGIAITQNANKTSPIQWSFYGGLQYCIEFSNDLCLDAGIGCDVLLGRMVADNDDSFNLALGPAAEADLEFHLNDRVHVSFGGKFAWHIYNSNKDVGDVLSGVFSIFTLGGESVLTNFSAQTFAGIKYVL